MPDLLLKDLTSLIAHPVVRYVTFMTLLKGKKCGMTCIHCKTYLLFDYLAMMMMILTLAIGINGKPLNSWNSAGKLPSCDMTFPLTNMQINLRVYYRGETLYKHYGNVTAFSSPVFAFLHAAAEVEMVFKSLKLHWLSSYLHSSFPSNNVNVCIAWHFTGMNYMNLFKTGKH